MIAILTILALAGLTLATAFASDALVNGWAPFFALCTGGAAHITWMIWKEGGEARPGTSGRRAA